jgi:hypothetical protein
MANFSDQQVMLTLAALTYRGFQDVLQGPVHEEIVRGALVDGLQTLEPVKNEWELVWGPATDRTLGLAIDTNMMYVVRSRRAVNRLVVAIRGTNPLSLPDWVFGDFWVGETVDWPYATAAAPAVISKSAALGLRALQAMRSSAPAPGPISEVSAFVAGAFAKLERAVRGGPANLLAATPTWFESQTRKIGELWLEANASTKSFRDRRRDAPAAPIAPANLRSKLEPQPRPDGRQNLLTFLRAEAERSGGAPLEVVVTGHSKGGALAQAAAVWLKDALDSADAAERWDGGRGASVSCYAFAGPTPGDTGFARRIERTLGQNHHHLRNMHDIVTRAWQVDELRGIPELYGARTAVFKPLVKLISDDVAQLDYRHARLGVTSFEGKLGNGESGKRDFATEFVYQHLDGYLEETKLHNEGIRAPTFFL